MAETKARRERPRSRTTSLLGPLALLIAIRIATSRDVAELAFLFVYAFLFGASLQVAAIWSENNPRERHLYRIEDFTLDRGAKTLLAGIAVMLVLFAFLLIAFRLPLRPTSWETNLRVFIDQVFIVATVEEFTFRWTLPRVLDTRGTRLSFLAATLIAQLSFAFIHPVVRENWLAGNFTPESISFFLYALSFGLLMSYIVHGARTGAIDSEYVGFGTAVGIHGTLNAVSVIWLIILFGIAPGPLSAVGPPWPFDRPWAPWIPIMVLWGILLPLLIRQYYKLRKG